MTETASSAHAPRYVIDSSCIIEGRNSIYGADIFPVLWSNIENLITKHKLYIPEAVIAEVAEIHTDDPASWVNTWKNGQFVLSASDKQRALDVYASLVPTAPPKVAGKADLHIIGIAKVLEATVVTQEKPPGTNKIPTICSNEGVDCISLMGLMRQEGWVFK